MIVIEFDRMRDRAIGKRRQRDRRPKRPSNESALGISAEAVDNVDDNAAGLRARTGQRHDQGVQRIKLGTLSDRVRQFFESNAFDKTGECLRNRPCLKRLRRSPLSRGACAVVHCKAIAGSPCE